MQEFKNLDDVFEPDAAMRVFSYLDSESVDWKQWDLKETHRRLSELFIEEYVPEDVRSYFNSIKNILLYSYFHYGFIPIAAFLATTAVEMALRTFYPWKPKSTKDRRDTRSFHSLFQKVIVEGRVKEEDFTWLPKERAKVQQIWDEYERATGNVVKPCQEPYEQVLLKSLVFTRNYFAHPAFAHSLITFEMAFDSVRPCADVINQIFKPKIEGTD
jgi:hypothetical protein